MRRRDRRGHAAEGGGRADRQGEGARTVPAAARAARAKRHHHSLHAHGRCRPRQPLAKFQRFFANSFFPALLEYYLTLSDSARIHAVVLLLRALIGDASFFAPALLASPYASTFSLNTPHAGLLCEEDRLYLQVVQRMLAQKKFLHYYKTHADPLRRCAETVTLFLRCQDLETVQSTAAKAAVVFQVANGGVAAVLRAGPGLLAAALCRRYRRVATAGRHVGCAEWKEDEAS